MFRKFFTKKENGPPLIELDELYRDTICSLNSEFKIAYCNRQLKSVEYDIKSSTDQEQLKNLNRLKSAINLELERLRSKS